MASPWSSKNEAASVSGTDEGLIRRGASNLRFTFATLQAWLGTIFATSADLNTHTGAANPHSGSASTSALNAHTGASNPHSGSAATSTTITGANSVAGGGDLSANRTLALVNDAASPGANQVYGTDGAGAKGWKADPSGGGGGDMLSPGSMSVGELYSSADTSGVQTSGTGIQAAAVISHIIATDNPHSVDAGQVGAIPETLTGDGDLLSYDGVQYTKVPVGTDGQVLTARPGGTVGAKLVWEAPSGGGGGIGVGAPFVVGDLMAVESATGGSETAESVGFGPSVVARTDAANIYTSQNQTTRGASWLVADVAGTVAGAIGAASDEVIVSGGVDILTNTKPVRLRGSTVTAFAPGGTSDINVIHNDSSFTALTSFRPGVDSTPKIVFTAGSAITILPPNSGDGTWELIFASSPAVTVTPDPSFTYHDTATSAGEGAVAYVSRYEVSSGVFETVFRFGAGTS